MDGVGRGRNSRLAHLCCSAIVFSIVLSDIVSSARSMDQLVSESTDVAGYWAMEAGGLMDMR